MIYDVICLKTCKDTKINAKYKVLLYMPFKNAMYFKVNLNF